MLKEIAMALMTLAMVWENPAAWNWHPNHLKAALMEKNYKACL